MTAASGNDSAAAEGDASPPPGAQWVGDEGDRAMFAVDQTWSIVTPAAGNSTLERDLPVMAAAKTQGVTARELVRRIQGADVVAVKPGSGGVLVALSTLLKAETLPSDRALNRVASAMGGRLLGVTHRGTAFGDTAEQRFLRPASGYPDGQLVVQAVFVQHGQVRALIASGGDRAAVEIAYQAAIATLADGQ